MTRDPVKDQQPDRHSYEDPELETQAAGSKQLADVGFLDRQVSERGSLGFVEQEDEEGVERVQGREQEVGRDVEGDEELRDEGR